jgi:GMP synthase (glutamine-hydrolysing)
MKRVLALQHTWEDPPGYLGEILQEHGIDYEVVDVEREPLPNLTAYQAVIIMGGSQHLYRDEHLPYFVQEKAALHRVIEEEIPTLGICLGGQLLASVLGADVYEHHQTLLGFFQISLTEAGCQDPLLAGLPGYQLAFHWNKDLFDLPTGAVRLASHENGPNQAFRYGKHIYGLQFHIELNAELIQNWLHFPPFSREIVQILGDADGPMRLEQEWAKYAATYHQHTRTLFENFLCIAKLI